jgi:hypothetical protein
MENRTAVTENCFVADVPRGNNDSLPFKDANMLSWNAIMTNQEPTMTIADVHLLSANGNLPNAGACLL